MTEKEALGYIIARTNCVLTKRYCETFCPYKDKRECEDMNFVDVTILDEALLVLNNLFNSMD